MEIPPSIPAVSKRIKAKSQRKRTDVQAVFASPPPSVHEPETEQAPAPTEPVLAPNTTMASYEQQQPPENDADVGPKHSSYGSASTTTRSGNTGGSSALAAAASNSSVAAYKAEQDGILERAIAARSPSHKTSTNNVNTRGLTPLQKHVGFWDRNKDGVIWPWETYAGFYALGFNPIISFTSALAFHILHVSYPTHDSWVPNPLLPVTIANIHRAKHGSDTETYDTAGRFVNEKFENTFEAYSSRPKKDGLTFSDITTMWGGNRNVFDFVGWSFQFFLWTFLWALAADPVTGVLSKEDVLKQYDGTLYYELEDRRKTTKLPWYRGGTGFGSPASTPGATKIKHTARKVAQDVKQGVGLKAQ
ncbi:Caleosin related protein-domain-containing protein [Fimicolochytrium jonesii]|uniref:Caleosin related protein-domain-containing protein n=1 Tax=Fimicolochytrium jonesii TaxID=1396493 RepID=UPI0022FEDAC7|nr:Caleosin related protein-domain-containing protein [Fimicolochytrium jonesii]KAI8818706.1 Caleosin related protein-domain-containing protein [Fimicolochytrium jonesii]